MMIDPKASYIAAPTEARRNVSSPSSDGKPPSEGSSSIPSGPTTSALPNRGTASDGSPPPDWNLVHFNVRCARCGQDLRGLTEPKCPACALDFGWADVVPLEELTCLNCGYHLFGLSETRCPECGQTFVWNDVLAVYHQTKSPYFEYQWRRRPLRSLWLTWSHAIRPWKLWNEMDIQSPPRVGSLLFLYFICAGMMVGVPPVLGFGFLSLINILEGYSNGYGVFFNGWRGQPFKWADGTFVVFACSAWVGVTYLTLSSMHWSLKACRVRRAHVLRVSIHMALLALPLPTMLYAGMFVADVFVVREFLSEFAAETAFNVALIAGLALVFVYSIVHIGFAYRRYIRMRHAWGVAVATAIAGLIGGLTVSSWRILFDLF